MNKKFPFLFPLAVTVIILIAAVWYLHGTHLAVLDPAGLIAQKESSLIILATVLSMIIIVPVFIMTIFIAWKYRESNTKAKHNPNWDFKPIVDVIWWTVPTILIIILSVIIWTSTHALDPFKPIASNNPPIVIQVVAMDWKWLFIYPQQGIATVNYFEFPENTPVDFEITSDAPMNSFWIPELGSQIYAMPSMSTELHLIASSTGTYSGMSANISGAGFADMTFTAQSVSQDDFNSWVRNAKQSSNMLTADAYNTLAQPGTSTPLTYSWSDADLYDKVLMKDMMQADAVATGTDDTNMGGMNMPGMDMQ
jgi:cytochrome o ubiquinol oxidase subunit 2